MLTKKSVLVIDDEPSVADALRLILSDHGYEVVVALTGRDGLDKAAGRKFDVTITDLLLPDIPGLEVITSMRADYAGCLVIVITANCTPEVVVESFRRGATDVLAKPFNPSDILTVLSKALSASDPEHLN